MTRIELLKEEIELAKELLRLRKELDTTNAFIAPLYAAHKVSSPINYWSSSQDMWLGVQKPHYNECSGPCECEPN